MLTINKQTPPTKLATGAIMSKDTAIFRHLIRLAGPADIPEIRTMQERSMRALGGGFYTSIEILNFITLFGTMDDSVVEEGHYFVAEGRCGSIVGSGGWSRSRPRYAGSPTTGEAARDLATIRSVFVDPAAIRCGVASAIMLQAERDALEHEVDTLHLTATLSGLPLYQALGYNTEEATELRFPDHTRFACVRMQKSSQDFASRPLERQKAADVDIHIF